MIKITDKSKCCGCNACVQKCPKQCITMHEDEEGFLYPHVNPEDCIDCGMCEKVCNVLNQANPIVPYKVFAAQNRNLCKCKNSSSGGVFISIAEKIIREGGVVFGAKFNSIWEVEHGYVETTDALTHLMRSKYVQSRIGNTYTEAEHFLKLNRKVLFVGTPCQIAGLKLYLRKEYTNLYTVDIICHGVPSPGVWRDYLNESINQQDLVDINFRDKEGYSWNKYGVSFIYEKDKKSSLAKENLFFKGFIQNILLRPSCYDCPAKSSKSNSDITLGDFWGVENVINTVFIRDGVSMIIVNTKHGLDLIDSEDLVLEETSVEESLKQNASYSKSTSKPTNRESFFDTFSSKKYTTSEALLQNLKNYSIADRIIAVLKNKFNLSL